MSSAKPKAVLKVSDVAEMFAVKSATVRMWLRSGDLKGFKTSDKGPWRVNRDDAIDYAEKRYGEPIRR